MHQPTKLQITEIKQAYYLMRFTREQKKNTREHGKESKIITLRSSKTS